MRTGRIILLAFLVSCSCQVSTEPGQVAGDRRALEGSGLYRHFADHHAGKSVLVWAFRDLDADGRDDLVVIYRAAAQKNAMTVVLTGGGAYAVTNDVPAPASNQVIAFKDIDGNPPLEFIVQGMKGGRIGYAVYRIEQGRLVDLFGEGMDECC